MKTRQYQPYFKEIQRWFLVHWPTDIDKENLPRRGWVSFVDGKPIMAIWLYKDETSAFCFTDWLISNPDSTREERDKAFPVLMDRVVREARKCGGKLMLTVARHPSLEKRLMGAGFIPSDKGVNLYMRGTQCQQEQQL